MLTMDIERWRTEVLALVSSSAELRFALLGMSIEVVLPSLRSWSKRHRRSVLRRNALASVERLGDAFWRSIGTRRSAPPIDLGAELKALESVASMAIEGSLDAFAVDACHHILNACDRMAFDAEMVSHVQGILESPMNALAPPPAVHSSDYYASVRAHPLQVGVRQLTLGLLARAARVDLGSVEYKRSLRFDAGAIGTSIWEQVRDYS